MIIKLNKRIITADKIFEIGQEICLEKNDNDEIKSHFWRKIIKDSVKDNCVTIISKKKKQNDNISQSNL